jgi:hypothetical protein
MRQRRWATIIINEGPNEGVARREQSSSKEGMVGRWMAWISCARCQGIHNNGERKRRVGITLFLKKDVVVRCSTPEVKEVFLAQLALLRCALHRLASGPSASAAGALAGGDPFLLCLDRRQDLQVLRDEVGRLRSGGVGGHQCRFRKRNPRIE